MSTSLHGEFNFAIAPFVGFRSASAVSGSVEGKKLTLAVQQAPTPKHH